MLTSERAAGAIFDPAEGCGVLTVQGGGLARIVQFQKTLANSHLPCVSVTMGIVLTAGSTAIEVLSVGSANRVPFTTE